ncbi:MAG TPA: YihY/virulence factor BrkB family protein [Nocardioidaceae bacterium]|nr:YihY/virulence factor BrkB family protein [Nocardioidaceae bacterium]
MARLRALVARLRERLPWLDHLLRMVAHYGAVNGNGQAGGVTFFGFLSFFPILALAFFVVGLVAQVYPDVRGQLVQAIEDVLPGVIGSGEGQIPLSTIEDSSGTAGVVGLVGVLYSGLGWLSGLRLALGDVFVVPRREHPSFVLGKVRDLGTLALLGLILLISVALSGAVNGFSGLILELLGIDPGSTVPAVALWLVGHALAIAASTVLLLTMYNLLLVRSHVPRRAMVGGALLGAVGFEVLKLAANLLLAQTKDQPAFQAFGVALILLVWINYFSRLVMYGAAWAYTAPSAVAQRAADALRAPGAPLVDNPVPLPEQAAAPRPATSPGRRPWLLAAGAAGVAALLVRGVRR